MNKTLNTILRTFRQSPDANALMVSAIVLPQEMGLTFLLGSFALKQYLWGHKAYLQTKRHIRGYIKEEEEVNERAIKRCFWGCDYFGSRYALREYRRSKGKILTKQ